MSRQYKHVPLLGPRHIRILVLQPATDLNQPLYFHLLQESLDNPPMYAALSYAWDDIGIYSKLECGDRVLTVTPNCETALRHLRNETHERYLWVDSICIDQTKAAIDERNQQVAIMGEIYKSADRVIIWLGEIDHDTEVAFRAIESIVNEPNRVENVTELQERLNRVSINVTNAANDPFDSLFKRSWFHRMWTLQEALLGRLDRKIVQCGSTTLPWLHLMLVIFAMEKTSYRWNTWAQAMQLQKDLMLFLITIQDTHHILRNMVEDISAGIELDPKNGKPLIGSLLIKARRKVAKMPEDKVFALYGIFQELKIAFPKPDYKKTVPEIYREAVITCIKNDRSLAILYYVPSISRYSELASWVPDFSQPMWNDLDPRYDIRRDLYSAGCSGSVRWDFSKDSKEIIVFGKIFSSLSFRSRPLSIGEELVNIYHKGDLWTKPIFISEDDWDEDEWMRIMRPCHKIFETMKGWLEVIQGHDYPTGETSLEALRKALLMDIPFQVTSTAESRIFDPWYNALTASDIEFIKIGLENLNKDREPSTWLSYEQVFVQEWLASSTPVERFSLAFITLADFNTRVGLLCNNKCIFRTENGYFGLAPDPLPMPVENGDRIALISGLQMPFLLRPVGERYRVISSVVVHGIMRGEVWLGNENDLDKIVLF